MSELKSAVEVLQECLKAKPTGALTEMAQLDAAELLLTRNLEDAVMNDVVTFLRTCCAQSIYGWTTKIRAAKILIAAGLS